MTYKEVTYFTDNNGIETDVIYSEITYLSKEKLIYHNKNGPALRMYYPNGNIEYENHYINGKLHNENGPAIVYFYPNGNKATESYFINDVYHNENGPTVICYNKNGSIRYQRFMLNNKTFKYIHFKNNKVSYTNYYFNEIKFNSKKKMESYIKLYNIS